MADPRRTPARTGPTDKAVSKLSRYDMRTDVVLAGAHRLAAAVRAASALWQLDSMMIRSPT